MKAISPSEGIVADGLHRIRSSESFQQKEKEIREKISQEFAWDLAIAPWWRKPMVKWKKEKKIQKELDLLAPRGALYFNQQKLSEQSGPDNPRPCGTSGTAEAGASAPPEASRGI